VKSATTNPRTSLSTEAGDVVRRRTGGRSARVQAAVIDATIEVLAEQGVESVSIADIAKRAGVHETSIYRRWGTRANLLLSAVQGRLRTDVPIPDTGTLHSDLVELLHGSAAFMQSPYGEALQRIALQSHSPDDDATRDAFLAERLAVVDTLIQRAATRGELRPNIDLKTLLDAILGPLNRRVLLTGEPLDNDFLKNLADIITFGISRRRQRTTPTKPRPQKVRRPTHPAP
jgi:AcrR family transcriptional regulator